MGPGAVHVTAIREIGFEDISPDLARRSGFEGVVDLLKVAKHGPGENVYLVEFEYRVWRVRRFRLLTYVSAIGGQLSASSSREAAWLQCAQS